MDDFKNGFSIEYHGPQNRQSSSDNIPFSVGNETEFWNKIMKEVKLGRVVGPFRNGILFENYIQSPIGLVPKAGSDQTRLIFHLLYEFKQENLGSVNEHTPCELCSVKYRDLDYAVKMYMDLCGELLAGTEEGNPRRNYNSNELHKKWRSQIDKYSHKRTIFANKSDLKSAFRILGLSPDSWRWLIMKA